MRRLATVLALLLGAPACAQDAQSWNTLLLQGPVDGKLLLWADLHAGYHYQHNNPAPGITSDEHRFWQQLMAPVVRRNNGFALVTRWRLEQRTFENASDLGWRMRMLWRVQQPLDGPGTAGPLAWSETFLALNSTDWGARGGFDQQRSFVGWLQPVGRRLNLEAGYLHQHVRRPGPDAGNHVLSLTLNRRLG